MNKSDLYFKQAQLIVRMLPYIAKHDCFALKGGTAINLFVRNLPRLSVDIDLVYVPVADRKSSLKQIDKELRTLGNTLQKQFAGLSITNTTMNNSDILIKFVAQYENAHVKVEVSPVARGTVLNPGKMDVCSRAEELLGFASINVVSFTDLFAGKLCAALDRQHPRDLFDVRLLFKHEGITSDLFRVFLVYLVSCSRPISELLRPNLPDFGQEHLAQFSGMPFMDIPLNELTKTWTVLMSRLHSMLEDRYKNFLLTFKQGVPDWDVLGLSGVQELPAVRWKLYNLSQMDSGARKSAIEKLEKVLYESDKRSL